MKKEMENNILELLAANGYACEGRVNIKITLDLMPEEQIKAMQGFINYCRDVGQSEEYICSNILHDLAQFKEKYDKEDDGSCPRIGSQYIPYVEEEVPSG